MYKFEVGDNVEVFEDVLTQKIHEGVAKIVRIHKQNKKVVDCDVKFYIDVFKNSKMEDDAVRRQIKVPSGKRSTQTLKEIMA